MPHDPCKRACARNRVNQKRKKSCVNFIHARSYVYKMMMCFFAFLLHSLVRAYLCVSLEVSISENGTDSGTCLNGITSCRTMDYVMRSLSEANYSSTSIVVTVSNNQYFTEPDFTLARNLTLLIQGNAIGQKPSITCTNYSQISFVSVEGSVSLERLTFEQCSGPHGYGLDFLRFYDCTITDSKGIGIIDSTYVDIESSDFGFVQPYSLESSLLISHNLLAGTTVFISNCTFISKCTGSAAIWITNANVQIRGNVTIANSTGYLGGAVRLTRSKVTTLGNATVFFVNNFAQYGSAVYMEEMSCPLLDTSNGNLSIQTINSKQSCVFIDNPTNLSACLSLTSFLYYVGNGSNCSISTSATSLSVQPNAEFTVIPGMDIILNLLVTDFFQNSVTCEGEVSINQQDGVIAYCNDPVDSIYLSCPLYIPQKQFTTLASAMGWNSTVQVQSAVEPSNTTGNISITFTCEANGKPNASVSFQLRKCPNFIMQFNNITHTCECISPNIGKDNYVCSVNYGAACIRSGYWKGWDQNKSVVLPCLSCKTSGLPCPLTTDASFHLLNEQPDNQCTGNKAGLLCSECKNGYYFSFPPLRCVADNSCSMMHSFGLLAITTIFEFTKAIIIFIVVSNKLGAVFSQGSEGMSHKSLGVGYFFSPLFFMASIGRLPLSLSQFSVLKFIVQAFRTITHLPLDIFGEIKWCFFPSLGALGIFAFQFLGPVVVVTMLTVTYTLVWLCPKVLAKFHPSPMQSISLLVLFTFWSLAATCINILQYKIVGENARVQLQPDLPYFTGLHLPLAIISIVFMVFLIFPLVIFLMVSPFLWKYINLSKVKPFLDEFQSCYKKSYRWYPSVYFIAWLVIVGFGNLASYLIIYVIVFLTLCILLAIFQPYEVRWLNSVDMLLLLDLLVMTQLLYHQTVIAAENVFITAMVYILVLVPLIFIGVGIIVLFITQCKPLTNSCCQNKSPMTMPDTAIPHELNTNAEQASHVIENSDEACRHRDSIIDDF